VPLASVVTMRSSYGPEFTMRYNEYRSAQINGILRPGVSTTEGRKALEEVFSDHAP
jgi:HAE1 family hydrophobic/amphiphilic exporter-1